MAKPPRRKCSSLDSFPRERILCVVIVVNLRPRELRSPGDCAIVVPLKACAAPRGLVSLGAVCLQIICRTKCVVFPIVICLCVVAPLAW